MSEIKVTQVSNILREYAKGIIHQPKEGVFIDFARILSENFTPDSIQKGLRALPRGSYFPALSDIEQASRPHLGLIRPDEDKFIKQYEIEEKRFQMLKETFGKKLGEAGLVKILNKWLSVYGLSDFMPMLESANIEKSCFLKPALFDLEKAAARTKENPSNLFEEFVKIVEMSRNRG